MNKHTDWWLPPPGTLLRVVRFVYPWNRVSDCELNPGDIVVFVSARRADLVIYKSESPHVDFRFLNARGRMQDYSGPLDLFGLVGDCDRISKEFGVLGPYERGEFDEGPFDYDYLDDIWEPDPWEKY